MPRTFADVRGVKLGGSAEHARAALVEAADAFAGRVGPLVLELHRAGHSLRQVAAAMDAQGIRTARGGRWEAATVRNLLARVA